MFQGSLCEPKVDEIQESITAEAHLSRYSIQLNSTKIIMTWEKYIGGIIWKMALHSVLLSAQIVNKLK